MPQKMLLNGTAKAIATGTKHSLILMEARIFLGYTLPEVKQLALEKLPSQWETSLPTSNHHFSGSELFKLQVARIFC